MSRARMPVIERFLRLWSPRRYCRWMLARAKRQREEKLKAAKSLSPLERRNLAAELDQDIWECEEWLREMEDTALILRARKMDVYLDDIPVPPVEEGEEEEIRWHDPHFRFGAFNNELLHSDCRIALIKAVRERYPTYRKERREVWGLWIQAGAILVGLIGAATGFIAIWKK